MKSLLASIAILTFVLVAPPDAARADTLAWSERPPILDDLGFAGAFAGSHGNALIVAGGANFLKPVWQNDRVWRDQIFVLIKNGNECASKDGGMLPRSQAKTRRHAG